MKQYMVVVGMEIQAYNETGNKTMRLVLQPLTNVKAKPDTSSISSLISFGKMIAKGAVMEEYRSNVFVPCSECYPWKNNGYKIGRHVTLEVLPDNSTGGIDSGSP